MTAFRRRIPAVLTASALALALCLSAPAARAVQIPVDLELVLAVDSSSSVDYDEFNLQAYGIAAAFRDARVIEAITSGGIGAIAVTLVQWASAGTNAQHVSIGWTLIDSAERAEAFAETLQFMPRDVDGGGTSIGNAIRFSAAQFGTSPYEGFRQVIDVSGDGIDNQVDPVREARAEAIGQGITINGLTILNEEPRLDEYYRREVIGGPGAFVIEAKDYADFSRAIRDKLLREISDVPMASVPPGTSLAAR
ncbi:MAG: DUF1194 domain-containing protein [Alphaproteobacteria bacterium]|nr:DUF1194 domain-containing protein [Alphaproteobacteria bacterium]MBU0797224.1 DUF1194 domain-containing protein [Alphaproteobacteria bacterium]MBU0888988.1 DUF1194 domain-containing protein [Alphaproteobacteria bacterium]MBU1814008.1 DUF1194 domain-containing protein [Alphaproteobacteria bacterium]MBU2091499.1 DUF1194 domain-containing protein [Alphaproteobacteria bacterium]